MKRTRRNAKKYLKNYMLNIQEFLKENKKDIKDILILGLVMSIMLIVFILSLEDTAKKYDKINEIKQQKINKNLEMEEN